MNLTRRGLARNESRSRLAFARSSPPLHRCGPPRHPFLRPNRLIVQEPRRQRTEAAAAAERARMAHSGMVGVGVRVNRVSGMKASYHTKGSSGTGTSTGGITCPQCFVGLCKKHPLQDSGRGKTGKVKKALGGMQKAELLKKLYDQKVGIGPRLLA